MNRSVHLEEIIGGTFKEVDLFCTQVEKAIKGIEFDSELFGLQLMLREGLINAVKYGCKNKKNLQEI